MAKNYNVKQFRKRNVVCFGSNIRFAKMNNRFINQVIVNSIIIPEMISVDPMNATIAIPSEGTTTKSFSVAVLPSGSNQAVTWSIVGDVIGVSINNSGLLTISPNAVEGTFDILVTSVENPTISTTIPIVLNEIQATAVNFGSSPQYIRIDAARSFTATVLPNNADQTIIWSVKNNPSGVTIDNQGLVSVTQDANLGDVITVVATSEATPSIFNEATFSVIVPEILTISTTPTTQNLTIPTTSSTTQFTVNFTPNKVDNRVTWSLNPTVAGISVDQSGLLTINNTAVPTNFEVVATSVFDATKIAKSNVVLTRPNPTTVSVTPTVLNIKQPTTGTTTMQLNSSVAPSVATQSVNWSINPTTTGVSIAASGLITISNTTPLGTFKAVATSTVDATKKGESTITIIKPDVTSVTISPAIPSLIQPTTGTATLQFTSVSAPSNADQAVTWAITPAIVGGSLSSTGLMTIAPNSEIGTYNVTATSQNGILDTKVVMVGRPEPTAVNVTPTTVDITTSETEAVTRQLSATVTPSNAIQTISWSLSAPTEGVSISPTGLLTVGSSVPTSTFNVVATSTISATVKANVIVSVTAFTPAPDPEPEV